MKGELNFPALSKKKHEISNISSFSKGDILGINFVFCSKNEVLGKCTEHHTFADLFLRFLRSLKSFLSSKINPKTQKPNQIIRNVHGFPKLNSKKSRLRAKLPKQFFPKIETVISQKC